MAEQNFPDTLAWFTCRRCGKPVRMIAAEGVVPSSLCVKCRRDAEPMGQERIAPRPPTGAPETDQTSETLDPAGLPKPRMALTPEVAGYTILGELGRGGMGVVYKAHHEKLKRIVALKVILAGAHGGSRERDRFNAEAEAVARLHHPGIVQVFEVGEQNGQPYLALEFVAGGTLKDRLRGEPQSARASAQLVEQLARAVHAAHLRGVVHRDLKPGNVLLSPVAPGGGTDAGGLGTPRITDFGLAKRLDLDASATRSGDILGTPHYMAPEQARGSGEGVGPATDVYALGVILYEMLTGFTPYWGEDVIDVLTLVATQPPVAPRKRRKGIPPDLEAVCLKCLEKDPRKRYASAEALADDLTRFLSGEPIRARPIGPARRLWRWCLRNPTPATLLLTVSLVLAFGLWHLSHLSEEMMRARAEKDAEQQTRMLIETMRCYSQTVIQGAETAGLRPTHDFRGKGGGIPFPVAFTIVLSEQVRRNADIDIEVRVFSDSRFRFRGPQGDAHLDEWEKEALKRLRRNPDDPVKTFTTYADVPSLRFATAMTMGPKCVECHNTHPESQKTDWEVGDVRGGLEIIRPLAGDLDYTRDRLRGTYLYLGASAAALLALCAGVLTIGRRRRWSGGEPRGNTFLLFLPTG